MPTGLKNLAPELVGRILHFLDTRSLVHTSQSDFALRAASEVELRNRVASEVGKHVTNPIALLQKLGEVGGIISGSTALAVALAGSQWDNVGGWQKKSDLDVYLGSEESLPDVVAYLQASDGYEKAELQEKDLEAYWEDIARIRSITRLRSPKYATHVDVICTAGGAATLALPAFWGTLVMNFITSSRLVILYPRQTLAGRGFTNDGTLVERTQTCQQKYERRGFNVSAYQHNEENCTDINSCCPSTLRYTEDPQCLSLSWDTRSTDTASGCRANSASFKSAAFAVSPTFWRWSGCEVLVPDTSTIGYMAGRL
ncbi:unnamed protein product [Peniophora sp. CBMAI 1063]|nr:unnamed protein product [Peniophora sp. CBMAI 1063]